jgi:hypothetical protein
MERGRRCSMLIDRGGEGQIYSKQRGKKAMERER